MHTWWMQYVASSWPTRFVSFLLTLWMRYIYIEEILILIIILEIRQELINNIANEIIIIFLIQETNTAYTK